MRTDPLRGDVGNELTGILSGTGAKMKGEVMEDHVVLRGAIKAEVPFEEMVAETRGTLLILSFAGNVVELGAGSKAAQLAAKIRAPPSRLDRLAIPFGVRAAVAGPIEAAFKSELATRADVVAGIPRTPVELLFFAVQAAPPADTLAKLVPLLAPDGVLWLVHPKLPESQIAAAAKAVGLICAATTRFSATEAASRLIRRA